ncbi:hypothetical protein SODALDRAFT_75985 [Sodiomyces alkalinus F11]|uniref:Protein kinase domain-containing protein n=1 Tax=Sodiomyces alkalinus (strain CBS 110278 / VKM F-3762 / F11) TaxID=1314773 RepID=A0A3N2PKQ8_SODAK|nr:hypothetical protein SODALDRAFT_75985 [Sodiomyces alkalinus F11]ROT35000.1 hypothetical protein SODALDRAFT_75985 [Sodiomyces alkalinus F11]
MTEAAAEENPYSVDDRRHFRNSSCQQAARYRGGSYRQIDRHGRFSRKPTDYSYAHGAGPRLPTDQLYLGKMEERTLLEPLIQGGEGRNLGYGITLTKVLAVGGFGIAALVEYQPRRKGAEKIKCVMKLDLYGVNELQNEEYYLKLFQGARHVVQILDATDEIKARREQDLRARGLWVEPAERPSVLIQLVQRDCRTEDLHDTDHEFDIQKQRHRNFVLLEQCEHGNLMNWLYKSATKINPLTHKLGYTWPDRILWELMECLVRGLIAVAYPVKNYPPHGFDPKAPVHESIPPRSGGASGPGAVPDPLELCHLDLNPYNLLVGAAGHGGGHGHGTRPIVKMADFGGMWDFTPAKVEENPDQFPEEIFWLARNEGKFCSRFPEQFTDEWDEFTSFMGVFGPREVNRFIGRGAPKPEVAGNFGMHSNIYQIGVTVCKNSLAVSVLHRLRLLLHLRHPACGALSPGFADLLFPS